MFKQISTLQTFAFIMNLMKYQIVSSFVTYGSFFFVGTTHQKWKIQYSETFFSAVVYTACNITHTIEKPFAALSVSSENFFSVAFTWKSTFDCVLLWVYQNGTSFTKSNDGTVIVHHVPFEIRYCYQKILECWHCRIFQETYRSRHDNYSKAFFTWKSPTDCVLLRLYPLLPKTALPTAQSSFTKSNDGTVTVHHVPFAIWYCYQKILQCWHCRIFQEMYKSRHDNYSKAFLYGFASVPNTSY